MQKWGVGGAVAAPRHHCRIASAEELELELEPHRCSCGLYFQTLVRLCDNYLLTLFQSVRQAKLQHSATEETISASSAADVTAVIGICFDGMFSAGVFQTCN